MVSCLKSLRAVSLWGLLYTNLHFAGAQPRAPRMAATESPEPPSPTEVLALPNRGNLLRLAGRWSPSVWGL